MYHDKTAGEKEVKDGKIFAVISYWLFLCILPFIMKKDNAFAVFHAKQGLILFLFFVAAFIGGNLPFLGYFIWRACALAYSVIALWGSVQALMGNYSRIPVVFGIAQKISI